MITVTDEVRFLAFENVLIRTGLHHRLLNLSQVARFIHPLVEARLKREVSVPSILMSLSRIQREAEDLEEGVHHPFEVERIHVLSGLATVTVSKTPESIQSLRQVIQQVQDAGGYLTYTEGTAEVTVILETAYLKALMTAELPLPKRLQRQIAGIGVTFRETYSEQPGFLYRLLQQVALQRINVIEVHSTMTEFSIYVRDEDVRLAFDSLYSSFARKG